MIDKLDSAVPAKTEWSRNFRVIRSAALNDPATFRRVFASRPGHYDLVGDYRPMGLPVRVSEGFHAESLAKSHHKIEIFDVGEMHEVEMRDIIEDVCDIDANEARILRLDLAADIHNVGVKYFRDNCTVAFKGYAREMGEDFISMRGVQTWYAGKKPNQIRIYDKTGERIVRMKQARRRLPQSERWDSSELAGRYEEQFGESMHWRRTRIERQLGGYDPAKNKLHLVADLQRLPNFYPFTNLTLVTSQAANLSALKWRDRYVVKALMDDIRVNGMAATRQEFYKAVGHHGGREWKKLYPFLCSEQQRVDHDTLRASYLSSVLEQLRGQRRAA